MRSFVERKRRDFRAAGTDGRKRTEMEAGVERAVIMFLQVAEERARLVARASSSRW